MVPSILENCGVHAEALMHISKTICSQKKSNGEIINQKEIFSIDNDIYEAYQIILGTLNDGESIGEAIEQLKDEVEKNGTSNNINGIAQVVSNKVVVKKNKKTFQNRDFQDLENMAAVVILDNALKNNEDKSITSIFDEKLLSDVDTEIKRAKSGNIESLGNLETVKQLMIIQERTDLSDDKKERATLAWMMNLAANDSTLNQDVLIGVAKKLNLDIIEKDSNNSEFISKEKLEVLFQKKLPENYKGPRSIQDFKDLNAKRAKRTIRDSKMAGNDNYEKIVEGMKDDILNPDRAELKKYTEALRRVEKMGGNERGIEKLRNHIIKLNDEIKGKKFHIKSSERNFNGSAKTEPETHVINNDDGER